MGTLRRVVLAAAILAVAPAVAVAQQAEEDSSAVFGWLGGAVQYGRATGEFANYVRDGIGLNGWLTMRLGSRSPLGVRLAGHVLAYGTETRRYPLVPGIDVDVTTRNTIAGLVLGPELHVGEGALGAYAFGGVGFNYFATRSSVEGSGNTSPFASTTNFDDFTLAGEVGGGLLVGLSRTVSLDLGARYVRNGVVTYVTKEGVSVSGSTLAVNPVTSDANLVVFHFGVTAAMRPGRGDHGKD
jgi:hypothetical protein